MSEIKHKICPYCGGIMKITEGKVCTSILPQYEYKCPECGGTDYDTRYFPDYPEIKAPIVVYGDNEPTEASYAVKFRNYLKAAIETADELIRQLKEEKK